MTAPPTRAEDPGAATLDVAAVAAATLDAGIEAALAATVDAAGADVRATLRPLVQAGAPARRPPSERLFRHRGEGPPPWQALPRLTWSAAGDAAEGTLASGPEPRAGTSDASAGADLAIRGVLGEGGMGIVMLAEQRSLRREVALKTVRPAADGPRNRELLWREAVVMGQLDHPNIVPVHVLGADADGRPALVMKRIEGWSWQEVAADPTHPLRDGGARDPIELHLEIAARVADALAFAHDHGVLHRDVKPENVMLGRYGEVYLGDWGVAVELATSGIDADEPIAVAGTPAFMAPEMLAGKRGALSPQTDVFLLGATLHAALTGGPRHRGDGLAATLRAAAAPTAVDYGDRVPPDVGALLNRATAANPARRPASASALRAELRELLRLRALAPTLVAAAARLRSFDAALAAFEAGAPIDEAALLQPLTEARFGYAQVLTVDADSSAAREGLRSVGRRAIRLELAAGHVGRARAALAELRAGEGVGDDERATDGAGGAAAVDPVLDELAAAIDALDAAQRAATAERAALESLGAAHDPRVGAAVRQRFIMPLLMLGMALFVFIAFVRPIRTVEQTLQVGVLNLTVVGVAALVYWRRLATSVNRDLVIATLAVMVIVLFHRLLVYTAGEPAVAPLLRDDTLIIATVASTLRMPAPHSRPLGVLTMMLTATAISLWPQHASLVFASGITSLMVGFTMLLVRAQRRPSPR